MAKPLLEIMMLAACVDNNPDKYEMQLICNYCQLCPSLENVSIDEIKKTMQIVVQKKELGVKDAHIIQDIADRLSKSERERAFALAAEVCAFNFEFDKAEADLLNYIKDAWNISKTTSKTVLNSIRIRYNASYEGLS